MRKCLFGLVLGWSLIAVSNLFAFDRDYKAFHNFLKEYVHSGRVDYDAIRQSSQDLRQIENELAEISSSEYSLWSKEEKLAFWINAYNLAAIKLIVEENPSKSIRQIPNVWKKPGLTMMGKTLSLDSIEQGILRREFHEPRIHFVLVCASLGCPILRSEPYRGEQLSQQLDEQTKEFLSDPQKFRYVPKERTVYLSPIFRWFADDFQNSGGAIGFIKSHLPPEDAKPISPDVKIKWLDYDWNLNQK